MKHYTLLIALIVTTTLFAACGGKGEDKNEKPEAPRAAVIEDTQGAQVEDVTTPYELKIGGNNYTVNVHRYSDTEKPAFKDEFGDEFYDNRIGITVRRDTTTLVQREFSLESFESYIPGKLKGKVTLQGIAPDEEKSTAQGIVFGVTIGDAGSDEGKVFLVLTIVPGSGDIDIRKDDTPDTTGLDQGKEGR